MQPERDHKRKILNLRIKRDLQMRMLWRIFLLLLVGLVVCSGVFYFFADQEVGETYRLFHVKAKNFLDFLLPVVIGAFLVGLLMGSVAALFFPKRIAGPLYRIERELDRIGDGDLTVSIAVRKRDELDSLAKSINRMAGHLRERISAVQSTLEEARGLLPGNSEMGEEAARLRDLHDAIAREMERFRLLRD